MFTPLGFKTRNMGVMVLTAALAACGGGGSNDGLDGASTQREQAAVLQKTESSIAQLQAGSPTADVTGPVLKNFSASKTDVFWPDSVTFSVEAQDSGSGLSRVELYEVGNSKPLGVMFGSPHRFTMPLGRQDNGVHAYYVRAYDRAFKKTGGPNATSNADAPLRVNVAIPADGLEPVGNFDADFGVKKGSVWSLKSDPHHDGVYVALVNGSSASGALSLDYARHSMVRIDTGGISALDIAFDPKRPDTLYMNRYDKLVLSRDAGTSWKPVAVRDFVWVGAGHMANEGERIYITPGGNKLFAYSSRGGYDGFQGWGEALTFSTDGGVSWMLSLYPSSYGGPVGPVMAALTNENIMYAGIREGVMRSSDGGRTFTRTASLPPHPVPPQVSVVRLSVDPFDADVVLALLEVGGKGQAMLFRTTNGGASWSPVQLPDTPLGRHLFGGQRSQILATVEHNTSVEGLVYVPVYADNDSAAVLRSKDGGASWELLPYFGPSAREVVSWTQPADWVVSTKPDASGAVQLFLPSPNGFNRYLDRTALK